jgi:hypothetical protein
MADVVTRSLTSQLPVFHIVPPPVAPLAALRCFSCSACWPGCWAWRSIGAYSTPWGTLPGCVAGLPAYLGRSLGRRWACWAGGCRALSEAASASSKRSWRGASPCSTSRCGSYYGLA